MTKTTITDSQILALRSEAGAAGDTAQVNLCDAALGLVDGVEADEARRQCAMVIEVAASARLDDESPKGTRSRFTDEEVASWKRARARVWLHDYATGEAIRPATGAEREASVAAEKADGGAGVIVVDGRSCYVQD